MPLPEGTYLLRLSPPYGRQTVPITQIPGATDANFYLSLFSGRDQSHLTTHLFLPMTLRPPHLRKLYYLLLLPL